MPKKNFEHWQCQLDKSGIAWLYFDRKGAPNSLNQIAMQELAHILDQLLQTTPQALVICSGKPNHFIMGADIEQFCSIENAEAGYELIRQGQIIFSKLTQFKCPTIALINGYCLGGGLELALACTYRIISDNPETKLALPEIKLGIHPGWGGTLRLPRLIGYPAALDMILNGRMISSRQALRWGLVDRVVPPREMKRAAQFYAKQKPNVRKTLWARISAFEPIKTLSLHKSQQLLKSKVNQAHYQAPYALLKNYQVKYLDDEQFLELEARSVSELLMGETSRNLVRVFFLRDQLKSQTRQNLPKPEWVHVIGAGIMGGDIAAWCVLEGFKVSLQDREPRFIAPAIKRAYRLFKDHLKIDRLVEEAMSRLLPDVEGVGVPRADIVIEAIIENLEAKQNLFKSLEPQLKEGAILATNTSSIALEDLAEVLQDPHRLIGLHFFNPVSKMPLVEIVHHGDAQDQSIAQALNFIGEIDRLPVIVKSRPGFLVNRVLMPYLLEAMLMLEEGLTPEVIDQAALDFGMPMGPLALADKVGLDICLAVAENLSKAFGKPVPERLKTLVSAKNLGLKSNQGFYHYPRSESKHDFRSEDNDEIQDRLILSMLNECVCCLRENLVASDELLDAAVIFGTGFAPFRGGPLHYAKTRGMKEIIIRLKGLQDQHGERFKPDAGWQQIK